MKTENQWFGVSVAVSPYNDNRVIVSKKFIIISRYRVFLYAAFSA